MTTLTLQNIHTNTGLLIQASEKGDVDTVKHLIPLSNPKANDCVALRWAVDQGHIEIVKLLLPVSDPKVDDSAALLSAAYFGHIGIVKLLLPVSDPKAQDSRALRMAAKKGYIDIVRLLLPVSDYSMALSILKNEGNDTTLLQRCIDEHQSLQQKDRLNNTLAETIDTKNNSVKRKM